MSILHKIGVIVPCLILNYAWAETTPSLSPAKIQKQGQYVILPGPDQADHIQVYYFKNVSKQGVWIDHPIKNPSLSAGWSSYLQAGNGSALALDRKNFAISCAVINPGKVDYLNCSDVLSIYSEHSKPSNPKQKGSAWIAEDLKWDVLIEKVGKRGFR
jgi:hypothetical protein